MTVIVSIDPGLSGAIALLDGDQLVAVEDMPAIAKRVNAAVLDTLLADWKHTFGNISRVVIENVHAMPKQGVTSSFTFGRAFGVAEGVAIAAGHVVTYAEPSVWKASMGLRGKPKDASRQLATDLWPSWSDSFKRVKDDGRAEAALMAMWGAGL
jgi:crossover junction endodeoxyribonuclease RuvC